MFCGILFNILKIFDLFFFDDVPNSSIEHVQVTQDLTIAEHSSNSIVSNCDMGFVATQRNSS